MNSNYKLSNYLKAHKREITSLDIKLTYLVSGSRDCDIIIWKLGKPKPTIYKILKGHKNVVQDVLLTNNEKYIISASWDQTLKIWNVENGQCIKTIEGYNSEVMGIGSKIQYSTETISSVSRNGMIMVFDFKDNQSIEEQEIKPYFFQSHHKNWSTCCKMIGFTQSDDHNFIFTSDQEGKIHGWSEHFINQTKKKQNNYIYNTLLFQNKSPLNRHLDNWGVINTIQFSPDYSFLAIGTDQGLLKVCSSTLGEAIFNFETTSPINHITFNPTKYWCISANDNDIIMWNLETKDIITTIIMDDIDCDQGNDNENDEKINQLIENQEWKDKVYYKTILKNRTENKIEKPLTRAMCIAWENGDKFFVGCEDGSIREYSLNDINLFV